MASAANQKSMELEGNLSTFQLADVLKFLAMGRMTGTLRLDNEQRSTILIFRDGMLTGSASEDRDVKMGQLLINGGHLNRRQLRESLELQRERRGNRRLGKILLDRKLVERETIQHVLALQVKEELWDAFSWSTGTFRFEHGGGTEGDDELLNLDVEPLITEGAKRLEQIRAFAGNLGQLDEIFTINPKLSGPPEAPLPPEIWRVLSLINGRLNVRGLVFLSGLGKFETLSALDRLVSLGLAVSAGQGAARVEPAQNSFKPQLSFNETPSTDSTTDESTSFELGGGLRSLFGRRRRSASTFGKPVDASIAPAVQGAVAGPFLTSVGYACALANHLGIDSNASGQGSATLESLWTTEACRHPRADLIRFVGGRMDASRFERYAKMAGGIDKSLAGCYEESMESLTMVNIALVHRVRQGAGADGLQRLLMPFTGEVEIRWPADFAPRPWIQQLMEE